MITNDTINRILKFRDAQEWSSKNNSKDLSMALSFEATELQQLFLWKQIDEVKVSKLKEELADVLIYAILLAEKNNFNIDTIIREKLIINESRSIVDVTKAELY